MLFAAAASATVVAAFSIPAQAAGRPSAGANVRVTVDTRGASYVSADRLAGGSYTDGVLTRCGVDRRMQNEPTLAIDPRNPDVRTAGANDYCTVPTTGDAWAGFYRSADGGASWTDSLVPGYPGDTSPQAASSPLAAMAVKGSQAAGDPVQAWDLNGNLFFMGNNFDRGVVNGDSGLTRSNFGDVWVATYAPVNPADSSTDGKQYLRTVLLGTNTPGEGQFNDKTAIGTDANAASPFNGNVYAAWSDFHGFGCNEIDFARSSDHGATFSAPVKISGGLCGNQGPNFAVDPNGTLYVSWQATSGGSFGQNGVNGAALVKSTDGGQTFTTAALAMTFNPFSSDVFSGDGSRECGDAPFDCPTGYTFPRFDLAMPTITANGTALLMAFQVALPSGQGQIQVTRSNDGGTSWSTPAAISASATGHQFFPWIAASGGVVNAVWYDSRNDRTYGPNRPPCNDAAGRGSSCLDVYYGESRDGGATWQTTRVDSARTNPNYEQFGGRRVPFFGDYIMLSAVGSNVAAVWTDSRDVVAAKEAAGTDEDGDDVAGDPEAGGGCTSALDSCFDGTRGLDQNIYTASIGQ